MYPQLGKIVLASYFMVGFLTACHSQKNESNALNVTDNLAGCYTVSIHEPALIKINHETTANADTYSMQMRAFNDPSKDWDMPTTMQVLPTNSPEIQKYFDIGDNESQFVEQVIARADRFFVLAKVTDSFARLNPQFDSPYLGFIYQGSNTIYKVSCDNLTQI